MAASKDPQIRRFRKLRNFFLARRDKARDRRAAAKDARKKASALRVIRRNRQKANYFLRKIRHRRTAINKTGVSWYDGKPVATWMVKYLKWARANGWQGYVTSGYRDPAYSESLCYAMCGAPACPGRCAGRSSNHSGSEAPDGALDVTDYTRFGQLMKKCPYKPTLINKLGAKDPVHYSQNGY